MRPEAGNNDDVLPDVSSLPTRWGSSKSAWGLDLDWIGGPRVGSALSLSLSLFK